jgi:hypothetical protein
MINQEIANHIFLHIGRCWDYCYPTGQALETAIFRGLQPFFETKQLGSPSTITDVKADDVSIDAKGNKTLKILNKITKGTNTKDYNILELQVHGKKVYLSVPKSLVTQVRRPKVDLQNYAGDAQLTLEEQIEEYKTFALVKSKNDGCSKVMSFVVQYIEQSNTKAATLTVSEFDIPEVEKYFTKKDSKGKNKEYVGLNADGEEVFALSSYNKGSSNMYKRFRTEQFYYRVWKSEDYIPTYNKAEVDAELAETGLVGNNID